MRPTFIITTLMFTCSALLTTSAVADTQEPGPLDLVLPGTTDAIPGKPGVTSPTLLPVTVQTVAPSQVQEQLREAVAEEQIELEQLDRNQLTDRAENGERGAQVALGTGFAQEAAMLSFAPAAANDALSDAVEWYSRAASRGFPGAPSLDQAGIQFYPIRAQREPRN